uniref:MIF4G domain-containing protein n=1 Tax=viral metagenome TaxID=1070528 RepID=A0A6C0IU43_9ZZZZ
MNMKYTIEDFNNISSNGFDFMIPEETINIINYLSSQVGSNHLLNNALFQKKQHLVSDKDLNIFSSAHNIMNKQHQSYNNFKKRKGNKGMEITDEDWDTTSTSNANSKNTFHSTKMEQKTGIDTYIDQVRLYINKLSDKTYNDMLERITEQIQLVTDELELTNLDREKLSVALYDMLSGNKFYSESYAKMYSELVNKFSWLKAVFNDRYASILSQYTNIIYVDSDIDYDGYCEMNKINEKRKSHTLFLVNLAKHKFIRSMDNVKLLKHLLENVLGMIKEANKKNEVDEITENIAILYNKEVLDEIEDDSDYDDDDFEINDKNITEVIMMLAKSKSKDYQSLSNKSIFKYMDLIEM